MNGEAKAQPQGSRAARTGEDIVVRKCCALKEFQGCVELQREIWGEADLEIEPVTMFVVASLTGGQVLGAFDGGKMVGYTLAVIGLVQRAAYLHSHQTGVSAAYRDRGVGKMLKLFQRDEALGRGIRLVEWTFDPLEIKNAHFNLNRVGGICRRYVPNLYDATTSPLHRGIPTDGLVAEWWLDSRRVIAAIQDLVPSATNAPATIELPAELEQWGRNSQRVQAGPARGGQGFAKWVARGYASLVMPVWGEGAADLVGAWSDF